MRCGCPARWRCGGAALGPGPSWFGVACYSASVALSVAHRSDGNAVGVLDDRVLLFVRSAKLTSVALNAVEATVANHVASASAARPVGALAVVPGNAGLSDNALLERQRALLFGLKAKPHVYFAFCVVGEGVQSIAMRAAVRVLVIGAARMRLFTEPAESAQWLAGHLQIEAAAITQAVDGLSR